MADPRTNVELLRRLEAAVKLTVLSEELYHQRVSLVYGNLAAENAISRQKVEGAIARIESESKAG